MLNIKVEGVDLVRREQLLLEVLQELATSNSKRWLVDICEDYNQQQDYGVMVLGQER